MTLQNEIQLYPSRKITAIYHVVTWKTHHGRFPMRAKNRHGWCKDRFSPDVRNTAQEYKTRADAPSFIPLREDFYSGWWALLKIVVVSRLPRGQLAIQWEATSTFVTSWFTGAMIVQLHQKTQCDSVINEVFHFWAARLSTANVGSNVGSKLKKHFQLNESAFVFSCLAVMA